MSEKVVRELKKDQEIVSAYPVMNELRTHLKKAEFLSLVKEAMEVERYKLFAMEVDGRIVAVTGFKEMTTLYYGRFVWVCDLVTSEQYRSHGYGEELLRFVENWSKSHGYERIALSSGLKRTRAHQFYESKMNYDRVSYVFKKEF
ncbi:Acetyltransferase (GNAT) family protein [Halobacillus dabanensis]|uniref:Acetyltransferase (GNAT) family protein n=1 Tax=Halobacillus dabanensis TaxID=240302 RepID=A0A1I3PZP7_HALDA|nr:GNAT family N-acetyltransferase [Halobacillus dabanensis]SFJ26919.1 Acetyltransferase (GNAT) family protein [Halobacillus dabanensis]